MEQFDNNTIFERKNFLRDNHLEMIMQKLGG